MTGNNNGVKVRDIVCGMLVDLGDDPKKADHNGETFFFCSNSCKERFLLEPPKYAGRQPKL